MKEETVIPPPHLISQKLDKEYFDDLLRENAELKRKIKALQNEIREKSREFYGLSWIDVPEAFEEESKNKIPVLEEVREKAVKNADGKPTHILIEGDNYHALTCLNYTHRGKVDVIYIDPPYNTGNDGFTYKDARFLTEFPDGAKIDKNHPLRHSAWLSFMAKRLELAKNLLSERGVIFISIDDNEQANLKLLCDRIFGEENFVATIPRLTSPQRSGQEAYMNVSHDYVLAYSYSSTFNFVIRRDLSGKKLKRDKNGLYVEGDTKAILAASSQGYSQGGDYDFLYNGKLYRPIDKKGVRNRWLWTRPRMEAAAKLGILVETKSTLRMQVYLDKKFEEFTNKLVPKNEKLIFHSADLMNNGEFSNPTGDKELKEISIVFAYPKPVNLVKILCELASVKSSIILDFFAGSGTTMHATMKLNAEDGGKRQCILVTNNENQICEKVTYERNRRVMCGYVNSKGENVAGLGNSMKYYRTAFVGGNDAKNARDRDRREFSRKAGALLSLAENTLEELSVPEAEAAYFQIFSDGKYRFTAVYFALDWTHLDALVGTLKTLSAQTRGKARFAIYVYCDGAPDIFEDDLADVPGATLKAIPRPILEIYKTINGGK